VLAAHPTLCRLVREALAGRPPLSRAETVVMRPGGDRLTLGFSLASLPGADGAPRGAALVFRDLTAIERSGERERMRDRLAALGGMAAGLAHELRNPLAGMEVAAGLLQRRVAGDPDSLALVADLRAQLRQLADTVTASLDFLRPLALRREPVDPIGLVEEAIARALPRASRPVRIVRRYAGDLVALHADRELLASALANLVVNALEAMEDAGACDARLRVEVEVDSAPELTPAVHVDRDESGARGASRELRFAIGDNGPGVPDAIRDRIFDPFFTTKDAGSGIGLATVQKVAAAHGGSLSLATGPEGSEFRLHLPLDESGSRERRAQTGGSG